MGAGLRRSHRSQPGRIQFLVFSENTFKRYRTMAARGWPRRASLSASRLRKGHRTTLESESSVTERLHEIYDGKFYDNVRS